MSEDLQRPETADLGDGAPAALATPPSQDGKVTRRRRTKDSAGTAAAGDGASGEAATEGPEPLDPPLVGQEGQLGAERTDEAGDGEAADRGGTDGVVTLAHPYTTDRGNGRRPKGVPPAGVSGSVAGSSRPESGAGQPKRRTVNVDQVTQSGELMLVRQGIRWYRVVGKADVTLGQTGSAQLVGTFSLRPADAPRADQVAEGAAADDPEADHNPIAYLERLRQNRQIGQHMVWGVERHRNGNGDEETCLVLLFGDQMQVKGLIPAHEAAEGDGRDSELRRLIGRVVEFRVLGVDAAAGLAALSRRAAREQRRSREAVQVGQVRHGVVASVLQSGAFIDIGIGREAWMPASEYDGRYLFDLRRRAIRSGDQFEVKVLKVEDDRVTVSRSALRENPWEALSRRFQQTGEYVGTVVGHTGNRSSLLIEFPDGTIGFSMLPRGGDPPIGSRVVVRVDKVDLEHRIFRVHVVRWLGRGRAS